MSIFSSCLSPKDQLRDIYDCKSPSLPPLKGSKTSFPTLVKVKAKPTETQNFSFPSECNLYHTFESQKLERQVLSESKNVRLLPNVRLPPMIRSKKLISKASDSIIDLLDLNLRKIVFEYLPLDRSLGELENIRKFIRIFPGEGYQFLAAWLATRILAGPKGCMAPENKLRTVSCFHYQKAILDAITDEEALYLKEFPEIIDNLTLQRNVRIILSRKVIKQLISSNEERSYQILARLLGKSELPPYDNHKSKELNNSLEGQEVLTELFNDNVLEQMARRVDLIEGIDLNAPIAVPLLKRACLLNPSKGWALFCRSSSNLAPSIIKESYKIELLRFIVEDFKTHLNKGTLSPMTMVLNSPLWKEVHEHLRKEKSKAEIHPAMEWFIAGINLATTVDCDLLEALAEANYLLEDLTSAVRSKITCLCLNSNARKRIPRLRDFIASFNNLRVLRLADDDIGSLPDNCQNLIHLKLATKRLFKAPPMSNLVSLELSNTRVQLFACLPNLKVFIAFNRRANNERAETMAMPKMPKVEIFEIDGYDCDSPDSPHLTRLMIKNNNILSAISERLSLEVLLLENCPKFTQLFAPMKPQEIPERLGNVQPNLHSISVSGRLGDSQLARYCNAWKKQWTFETAILEPL